MPNKKQAKEPRKAKNKETRKPVQGLRDKIGLRVGKIKTAKGDIPNNTTVSENRL